MNEAPGLNRSVCACLRTICLLLHESLQSCGWTAFIVDLTASSDSPGEVLSLLWVTALHNICNPWSAWPRCCRVVQGELLQLLSCYPPCLSTVKTANRFNIKNTRSKSSIDLDCQELRNYKSGSAAVVQPRSKEEKKERQLRKTVDVEMLLWSHWFHMLATATTIWALNPCNTKKVTSAELRVM